MTFSQANIANAAQRIPMNQSTHAATSAIQMGATTLYGAKGVAIPNTTAPIKPHCANDSMTGECTHA